MNANCFECGCPSYGQKFCSPECKETEADWRPARENFAKSLYGNRWQEAIIPAKIGSCLIHDVAGETTA